MKLDTNEKDIITEYRKILKAGWGKVFIVVTKNGKKTGIDTLFSRINEKEIKVGGND